MIKDYGKLAYLKVIELERQLSKFKNQLTESNFNSLTYNLGAPDKRLVFFKKIKFLSNASQLVSLYVNVKTKNNLSIHVDVNVLGKKVFDGYVSNGTNVITLEVGVDKGECTVEFTIRHGVLFVIDEFTVNVSGKIDYLKGCKKLSSITLPNRSFVSYLNDSHLQVYSYTTEDGFSQVFEFDDVKEASIAGYVNGELYVVFVTTENVLKVLILTNELTGGMYFETNVNDVVSACGYPYGEGIKIVFVCYGQVYIGEFVKWQTFKKSSTSRKGAKVTAEADVPNVYVVTDVYNTSKLID